MAGKRGRKKGTYTRKPKPVLELTNEEAGPSKSFAKKREKATGNSSTETTPIKGFSPEEQQAASLLSAEKRILSKTNNSQEEPALINNFDNLIDPNYKTNFPNSKKIRTYTNKTRKKPAEQQELVEFQNDSTRDSIIKWLNDNKNTFDRLTQTQCECCEESYPNLDIPSVSQKLRPYNLRPRLSLELKPKKNSKKGIARKNFRHSLAGDTPTMENYHIEDYCSDEEEEIPAIPVHVETTNAKFLINLMEDEYLTSLQQEINNKMLVNVENEKKLSNSGWDRFKNVNDSKRGKKKLKIDEKSLPEQARSYNCVEVEEYFAKNIKKDQNYEVAIGENVEELITNLLNLRKEQVSSDFRGILHRLEAAISEFIKPPTFSNSTQTECAAIIQKADKSSQVLIETRIASNQTEEIKPEKKNQETQVQTEHKSVEIQTEQEAQESQTDSFDNLNFDTDEFINNCEKNDENKPVPSSVLELSPLIEQPPAVTNVNVSKRIRSPCKNEEILAKRPCNKFVNEDLSIDFDSCAQNFVGNTEKVIILSDSEEIMKDIEFRVEKRDEPRSITQELIEECDLLIYNATRPQKQQTSLKQSKEVVNFELDEEKQPDLDYFETSCEILQEEERPSTLKSRRSLFQVKQSGKVFEGSPPLRDISFIASNNNNKEEEDTFERIMNQISTPTLIQRQGNVSSLSSSQKENYREKSVSKIVILENIVLKQANCFEISEEEDIIETTPQKPSSFSKCRNFPVSLLAPPLEFQDSESTDLDNTLIPSTPPLESNKIKKITSTQLSNRPDSEIFSISAIPLDHAQEEKLKPITLIQRKLTPSSSSLPQKPSQRLSSSSKQKSILNYLNKSCSSPSSQDKKPCIACSRLSKEQVIGITSLTHKKLASYSSTFSSRVTHLIVSTNEKNWIRDHTIKYVSAVAAGIWILSYKWIEKCISSGVLVDEEEFEVLDLTGIEGPKKSRLNRLISPLFKGYKVYVAPPFSSTTREEVERVIELMGGRVVATPDDLLEKKKFRLIITEVKATEEYEVYDSWLEALQVITVDLEWLCRSVGGYKLIPFQPFVLCSEDNLEGLDYPPELLLPCESEA